MDVESDGSERWEDFFGSSTEIGPSVLGYLDSLADNFNEEAKQLVESSTSNVFSPLPSVNSAELQKEKIIAIVVDVPRPGDAVLMRNNSQYTKQLQIDCHNVSSVTPCKVVVAQQSEQQSALETTSSLHSIDAESSDKRVRKFPDFRSSNVQRMMSHTNENISTISRTPGASTFLHNHAQSSSFCSMVGRKLEQPTSTATATLDSHKNVPLSKNITQLSQESSKVNNKQRSNEYRSVQSENQTTDKLHNVSTLQRKIHSLTVDLERGDTYESRELKVKAGKYTSSAKEAIASQKLLPMSQLITEGDGHMNRPLISETDNSTISRELIEDAFVNKCIDSCDYRNTVVETSNVYLLHDRQKLSDARVQIFDTKNDHKALPIEESSKISLPIGDGKGSFSDNVTHSTSTSTPSLDTMNSGSLYSSKASLVPPSTSMLNSRPLSGSSIGSYSSSSSSSDLENLLIGAKSCPPHSYQASVESLADPIEPGHVNLPRFTGKEQENVDGLGFVGGCDDSETVVIGMTMCERAVREIIDSESSYVKDLGQVIRGYLEDWKERACLKPDQLNLLFGNIQQIYDFNFKLLNRLRDAKGDPMQISDCFIDLHIEFSCYTKYCTSYPDAISLLTSLLQATHTNALLVSTQKMLKHTLPLGSYLLKPVQRILKYHLLLENLRKHCNDQQVALAHELMKKVAQNIDQMKKKLDQQRLVKELAGILDGWLGPNLSVLGDLLREGHLMEHAKPRIALLFQSMLIIAKPKEDKRLQFRAYIPCKNLMLVEHLPGEPASFNVIPFDDPKGVLKLTARNRDEKRHWTQQIKQAMLQHYSDIPKRAMELVLQLGDEDERFTDKPYWKRATNNSPVPEYLERRQQFRRSEMRMRSKKNLLKKDAVTPTFRSYSSDLESVIPAPVPLSSIEQHHSSRQEECKCDSVKRQLQQEINNRPDITPTLVSTLPSSNSARNLSETRDEEQKRLHKSLYERKKLSVPTKKQSKFKGDNLEGIKSYSSTMIPKRISEMRKRRPKTLTGSSTFYTDLDAKNNETLTTNHESHTFLKSQSITTGTSREGDTSSMKSEESLSFPNEEQRFTGSKVTCDVESSIGQMKDSEIISKLIRDVEQFNKILNKPITKKKSFDSATSSRPIIDSSAPVPDPPSSEPPFDDEAKVHDSVSSDYPSNAVPVTKEAEPIYESLLRNVHVPYKYAPTALARHSLPCVEKSISNNCLQLKANGEPTSPPLTLRKTRPESDYVTLAYSEMGLLERIEGDNAGSCNGSNLSFDHKPPEHTKTPHLLRNSDTNISYHREINATLQGVGNIDEERKTDLYPYASPVTGNVSVKGDGRSLNYAYTKQIVLERQGSLNMKTTTTQKSILRRFISLHSPAMSSRALGSDINLLQDILPLQRKFSDPNGGYGRDGACGSAGHIYKLGSMDLGLRIAHLDYADPKTLFSHPSKPCATSTTSSMLSMTGNGGNDISNSNNKLINRDSIKSDVHGGSCALRDSVLASSSSSDSVCEEAKLSVIVIGDENDENGFYERTVEECLEYDFRDSAVYSGDDNDRRVTGTEQQNVSDTLCHASRTKQMNSKPGLSQRICGPPPPIPTKPAHLTRTKHPTNDMGTSTTPKPSNNRGWVLQQVKRFQ